MAGSPECPVKILYRKQQQQCPQHITRNPDQFPSTSYLPAPARLYSTVLQAAATTSNIENSSTNFSNNTSLTTSNSTDSSSSIIQTIKDTIGKSQSILLDQKCETTTQQQLQSHQMIHTELLLFTNQHHTKLSRSYSQSDNSS